MLLQRIAKNRAVEERLCVIIFSSKKHEHFKRDI